MPLRSMTGFAQVKGQVSPELGFTLSLKSVNHRFLDVHFRLPADSDVLEMKLRRLLLLQQAAELHFQHVAIRRKTEVNVKEAMIHRFQRQSKPKFRADLPLYLRKSRHGAERHSSKFRLAVFRLPIENQ